MTNTVSRETFISECIDIHSLWYAGIFADADHGLESMFPWNVLRKDFKTVWIKGRLSALDSQAWQKANQCGFIKENLELQYPDLDGEKQAPTHIQAGAYLADANIAFAPGCLVESSVYINGPSMFGPGTQIRHSAYVRGAVLTGEGAVIGHSTEVKSSLFGNQAKAGHFAYVGDSILGNHVNLGAGTKLSNLKITPGNIHINWHNQKTDTGLRKFGAILGDGTQTGCNSVLNPGCIMQAKCMLYPNATAKKGLYTEGTWINQ